MTMASPRRSRARAWVGLVGVVGVGLAYVAWVAGPTRGDRPERRAPAAAQPARPSKAPSLIVGGTPAFRSARDEDRSDQGMVCALEGIEGSLLADGTRLKVRAQGSTVWHPLSVTAGQITLTRALVDSGRWGQHGDGGEAMFVSVHGYDEGAIVFEGDRCVGLVLGRGPSDAAEAAEASSELACPIDPAIDLAAGWGLRGVGGAIDGRRLDGEIEDGHLVLGDVPEAGEAWFTSPSHPAIRFTWDVGGCDAIVPQAPALVHVEVIGMEDGQRAYIGGCGLAGLSTETGAVRVLEITPETCMLEAWRFDGRLRALSAPVLLDPAPGESLTVELILPEERMAGMGVSFAMADDAIGIRWVVEGSPAWHAGLRGGERILEVDGEPTDGLTQNDFIAMGTGPEGTAVTVVVEDADGAQREVTFARAPIGRDRS